MFENQILGKIKLPGFSMLGSHCAVGLIQYSQRGAEFRSKLIYFVHYIDNRFRAQNLLPYHNVLYLDLV